MSQLMSKVGRELDLAQRRRNNLQSSLELTEIFSMELKRENKCLTYY